MLEDYKKYYYGRTDMTMLNDEKVYGSLGINLKKITTIVEGVGSLMLPNGLKAPLERLELIGNSVQGENPSPDNPQEIKSAGKYDEVSGKYLLDVKVTGKNLFDIKDITSETPQWLEIPCLIKNNIYIKSNNSTVLVENNQARLTVCFKDGTSRAMYDDSMTNGLPFKANSENPITTIKVRGTHIKSGVYSGIQVEYGNEPTPYEPYTEQSVQIILDEPLRGIGKYKDTITKDGVVRKIHEQTLKKEQISVNAYNWDTKYFRLYVIPDKKIDSSISIPELFSNMFKKFVIYKGNPIVYWIISEEEIRSMGITETDSLQVAYEKIKDFVTTNDIVIQYPIVETTLEPLPESVQAQLQALHSENGTTHVFVDSGEVPCGIKVEYVVGV